MKHNSKFTPQQHYFIKSDKHGYQDQGAFIDHHAARNWFNFLIDYLPRGRYELVDADDNVIDTKWRETTISGG